MVDRSSYLSGNTEIITFKAEHGSLDATYNPTSRWYGISLIFVAPEHRRQGIGKELIREAHKDALEKDARLLYAGIISRESLVAFVDVFGEEAVKVEELGEFTDDDYADTGTQAALLLDLE